MLVLAASPQLELLDLHVIFQSTWRAHPVFPLTAAEPRIAMRHLHTIKLRVHPAVTHSLLSSIHAPSVRLLELHLGNMQESHVEYVAALCQRDVPPSSLLAHVTHLVVGVSEGERSEEGTIAIEGLVGTRHAFLIEWQQTCNPALDAQTLTLILCDILHHHAGPGLASLTLQSDYDSEDHLLNELIPYFDIFPCCIILKGASGRRLGTCLLTKLATQPNVWPQLKELVLEELLLPAERIKSILTPSWREGAGTRLRVVLTSITVEAESSMAADTLMQSIHKAQSDGTNLQYTVDISFQYPEGVKS